MLYAIKGTVRISALRFELNWKNKIPHEATAARIIQEMIKQIYGSLSSYLLLVNLWVPFIKYLYMCVRG